MSRFWQEVGSLYGVERPAVYASSAESYMRHADLFFPVMLCPESRRRVLKRYR